MALLAILQDVLASNPGGGNCEASLNGAERFKDFLANSSVYTGERLNSGLVVQCDVDGMRCTCIV